jgi:hypothetical protein
MRSLRNYRNTILFAAGGFAVLGGGLGAMSPLFGGPFVCTLILKCASTTTAAAAGYNCAIGASAGGLFGTIFVPPFLDWLDRCCQSEEKEIEGISLA